MGIFRDAPKKKKKKLPSLKEIAGMPGRGLDNLGYVQREHYNLLWNKFKLDKKKEEGKWYAQSFSDLYKSFKKKMGFNKSSNNDGSADVHSDTSRRTS